MHVRAWGDDGITRFRLPAPDRASAEHQFPGKADPQTPPPHVAGVIAQAEHYLAGARIAPLRKVGFGETVTYGELAKHAGVNAPQAA